MRYFGSSDAGNGRVNASHDYERARIPRARGFSFGARRYSIYGGGYEEGESRLPRKPVDSQKLCQLLSDILKKDRVTRKAGMEPEEAKKLFLKLSPRRQEIAKLISKGLLKREVAERLNINLKTVEAHCQFIYSQLNVHSVVELSSIICGAELSQD